MNLLAQTSQPYDLNIPGLDWSHPAVKWVLLISGVSALILYLFNKVITPMVIAALKSAGVIKRTWREELEARVDQAEQKAATAEVKAHVAEQKAQVVAQNVTALNQVVDDKSPMAVVSPILAAKVEQIGTGAGGPPQTEIP